MKNLVNLAFVAILFSACGDSETKTETKPDAVIETVEETSKCTYTYNNETTGVFWTSFKHTARVGVKGRFETFDINGANPAASPEALLLGLKMSIDVVSVNSNDTTRDGKLRRAFFGNMMNTEMITGEIIAVNGTTGKLRMKMNDVENEVPFDLSITDEEVEVRATIDVLRFSDAAFDALGEACAEKHTGGDGVKKFWSEVDIYIKTTLNKECKD
jgi:polyisoprenoid-binding protein YceI